MQEARRLLADAPVLWLFKEMVKQTKKKTSITGHSRPTTIRTCNFYVILKYRKLACFQLVLEILLNNNNLYEE